MRNAGSNPVLQENYQTCLALLPYGWKFAVSLKHCVYRKLTTRIPHPTRYLLAALGRATFPPGEGMAAVPQTVR